MVKVGVLLPSREAVMYDEGTGDPPRLVAIAGQAETLGYDSVWAGDSLLAKPIYNELFHITGEVFDTPGQVQAYLADNRCKPDKAKRSCSCPQKPAS